MPFCRCFVFSLAFISMAGCSPENKTPEHTGNKVAEPDKAVRFKTLEDVPQAWRDEFERFAQQLEGRIIEGETNEVLAAFDRTAIADEVCAGLKSSPARLKDFKAGLRKGLATGVGQLVDNWTEQEDVKFKHLVLYEGEPAARFRFAGEETGVTLIDLVLMRDGRSQVRIGNFFNHAIGFDMVEQGRLSAAPVLAELDRSAFDRILGAGKLSKQDIQHYLDLSNKASAGDDAGVIATYKSLPQSLKENLTANAQYIMALQRSGNDDEYRRALKEAAVRFKTASFQFMLVDAYFLEKEYDKAVACIDVFMEAIEKDAALLALKSLLLNAKGDIPAAHAALRESFSLEPDCVYARSNGLDVLLAAKDWKAVRETIVFLETEAGYDFKGNLTDPVWDEFKKTPESAEWR